MQKIKSAALALPALLLAGCAAALPAENTATIETAAAAAPQTLKVYTSASLAPAAQAYAEAQGVALTLTDEAASADLLLTDHAQGGSLLGLAGALPVLLGDNIGTTITAVLASLSASRDAKRVAAAHAVFNLTGAAVFCAGLPLYVRLTAALSPKGPELAPCSMWCARWCGCR